MKVTNAKVTIDLDTFGPVLEVTLQLPMELSDDTIDKSVAHRELSEKFEKALIDFRKSNPF